MILTGDLLLSVGCLALWSRNHFISIHYPYKNLFILMAASGVKYFIDIKLFGTFVSLTKKHLFSF